MAWYDLSRYFSTVPSPFLEKLFQNSEYPWSPLSRLKSRIEESFADMHDSGRLQAKKTVMKDAAGNLKEGAYHVTETETLTTDFVDADLKISIKAGTFVEAGSTIKNHTIVEAGCEIRQGAYLRGNAYIGEKSVVGHTTEIKNAVFSRHVEAGHFAYIGDTLIGSYVNLGAGTKISNLEFRSLDAKQNDRFPQTNLMIDGELIKTGISKFGAIIGDGCETGCNSVLCPFVMLEPRCWIMPNYCVLKGVYKQGSILRDHKSR